MRRRIEWALLLLCVACKPAPPAKPSVAAGPTVRATVVTIRTAVEPSKKTYSHDLVIAGDLARSTDENDTWRLFDVKRNSVTFVDDVAKTFRTEPVDAILKKRRAAMRAPLPAHIPRAQFSSTNDVKVIQGVQSTRFVVKVGEYQRDLWMGEHQLIPTKLFAMMQATDTPSTPLAPMMNNADEALTVIRGFPLAEHAELPYGKSKMVLQRDVVSIVAKDVPKSLVAIPAGYREIK